MKKVIVTGGNGLIGSAFQNISLPKETEFFFVGRSQADLRDFKATLALFEKIQPDGIIHLAAKVGGIGANQAHPGTFFYDNILINANVLEAGRQVGVKKLVSFLSTCVFPDKTEFPMKGKQLHNGPPHDSNFGYAHAKRMLELQARAYRKEFGCSYVNVVGTNLYGPNDNFNLIDGHAVAALIHRTFLAQKERKDLTVWGTGKPLREFLYSEDVAKIALWALQNYDDADPLMMSTGVESSIKELVETIVSEMDFKEKVIWDTSKQDGQYRKPSDATRLKESFPELQMTSLKDGIHKTITWFKKHYPNLRK